MTQHGLLTLNKPSGATSRDVVNRVQRLLPRKTKLGHAGTLDPLATGVLVVAIGAATRLIEYVQHMPKTYRGVFLFGRHSPTEDTDGDVTMLDNPPVPSLAQIEQAARPLIGQIQQRPPAYSAVKVAGRRAYALARKGEQVELKPRPIVVHRLEVESYDYPELKLHVECGSGTYVRSLGRDLAESLGTAAVMSALDRTAIGHFRVEDAIDPATLTRENLFDHLAPSLEAVRLLPRLQLSDEQVTRIRAGNFVLKTEVDETIATGPSDIAAVDLQGRLVAVLTSRGPDRLGAKRNLPG